MTRFIDNWRGESRWSEESMFMHMFIKPTLWGGKSDVLAATTYGYRCSSSRGAFSGERVKPQSHALKLPDARHLYGHAFDALAPQTHERANNSSNRLMVCAEIKRQHSESLQWLPARLEQTMIDAQQSCTHQQPMEGRLQPFLCQRDGSGLSAIVRTAAHAVGA